MTEQVSRRLVSRATAARMCDLTPRGFSHWVERGIMPKALPGTNKWDLEAINQRIDEMSGIKRGAGSEANDNAELRALDDWKKKNGFG